TLDGEVRGTPGYMAPERIHKLENASIQTDVYSLGALLYSILTLKCPLEGDVQDMLGNTIKGNVIDPLERTPERQIPASLNAVVVKAMKVDSKDRYKSVNAIKADVSKYLEGYSTSAEDSSLLNELGLFIKRNKKSCSVGLTAVFILIVSTVLFISNIQKEKNRAVASEKQALENYNRYLQEKELADISLESDPTSVLAEIKMKFLKNYFKDPHKTVAETLSALKRVEESNDFDKGLYEFMGDVLFVCQKFDESYAMLKKGYGRTETKNEPLFAALEAIKEYKSDGNAAPLSVIKKLAYTLDGSFSAQYYRLVFYDRDLRANFNDHLELIKLAFKGWDLEAFEYIPSTKTLRIKGESRKFMQTYSVPQNAISKLSTIEVDHLILENCPGIRNRHLEGLKLKSLDIRGTELVSTTQAMTKAVTEKLIVRKELIRDKVLKRTIENGVEVVFGNDE
ncbi:MAG: hypothetical protein NE328_03365, partial [Lentisphaeraceae bacterium]|nr:hypothetical protein [Lentisphaeraceae bacterium]